MARQREFRLVQDVIPVEGVPLRGERRSPLVVPPGVSYLSADPKGNLRITTAPPGQLERSQLVLEPVYNGHQTYLLLVCGPRRRVRVNGRAAPQLCLLGERDEIQPDEDHVLHVSVYAQPDIGLPSSDKVGSDCPVCRSKIGADTRVFTCSKCGTAIHLQGDETPPEERLECALAVSDCPVCGHKIEMTADHAWEPELYCG